MSTNNLIQFKRKIITRLGPKSAVEGPGKTIVLIYVRRFENVVIVILIFSFGIRCHLYVTEQDLKSTIKLNEGIYRQSPIFSSVNKKLF